jgi:hypothetical protein
MMKLWERNDAPPLVDGAPGATGAHPYLVLCHRPPEEAAASSTPDGAPSDDANEGLDLDDSGRNSTAVVYQWVRIPR